MDFFEVVRNIGSLIGLFLSVASAIGIFSKIQNRHFKQMFDEHSAEIRTNDQKQTREIEEIKDSLIKITEKFDDLDNRLVHVQDFCAEDCRNAIKNIYYQYYKIKKIPLYERKMADALYKIYSEELHQNSYGQLLYEEICKWEIDSTESPLI